MNYFVFTLKSRKLYKEINGDSSWVTNQVIPGAHTKVTGKLVFLLRSRNYEIESHLGFPGRKAKIFSIQVSSRARWVHSLFLGVVRENIVSQKRQNTTILCWSIVSFRDLILIFQRASRSLLYGSHRQPTLPVSNWCYSTLGVSPILRFLFPQNPLCSKTTSRSAMEGDVS